MHVHAGARADVSFSLLASLDRPGAWRKMAEGQSAIGVPTLAFAPTRRALPGLRAGVRRGWPGGLHLRPALRALAFEIPMLRVA